MKHLYLILSLSFISCFLFGCVDDPEMGTDVKNAQIPTVSTLTDEQHKPENLATTIAVYAEVTSGNGLPVERYGICWGTESNPTVEKNDTTIAGKGLGVYKSIAKDLDPNTDYYIRPYATNAKGTNYGEEILATTTEGLGTVRTIVVQDSIKAESAICGGKILDSGEGNIVERGVLLTTPTKKDSVIPITMEADSFVYKITKLDTSTVYTVQAYVKNEFGTFKGSPLKFTTTNGLPKVTSLKNISAGYTDADFEAEVQEEGDSAVTVRGLCWGTVSGLTVSTGDTTVNGAGKGKFQGQITDLESANLYYVRAYATNAYGTAYSNEVSVRTKSELPQLSEVEVTDAGVGGTIKISASVLDEGENEVTESGISYSQIRGDESGTKVAFSSGKESFEGYISGLKGGVTYYLKVYAINKNGVITYGEEAIYKAPDIFVTKLIFNGKNQIGGAVATVAMGDNALILGGDMGAEKTDEFWAYRADKTEWLQLSPFPIKRKWQTAVNLGFAVIAFGGVGNDNQNTNDLYMYFSFTNYWEKITYDAATNVPDARNLSAGFAYKDSIFILGGIRSGLVTDEVWSIKPSNAEKWVRRGTFPEKQCRGIAVVIGDKIYAGLGYKDLSIPSYSRKLFVSEDGANTWRELSSITANVRCGVAFGNDIYVVDDSGYIWKYDTAADKWTRKSQMPSGERDIYCIYALDGLIYLGQGTSGSPIISYDPSWDN